MQLKDFIPQGILPAPEEDAIALLRADHDKVEDLFSSFDEIKYGRSDSEKKRLVSEICREIRTHSALEEELFYPAVRAEVADDDLMNEATVEHDGIGRLVSELQSMDVSDDMLNAKMHVLEAYIAHHVREEEENIFPRARESGLDMAALAAQMIRRRSSLADDVGRLLQDGAERRARASTQRKQRSRSGSSEPRIPR
jgi:hemerythrin superfamily protein